MAVFPRRKEWVTRVRVSYHLMSEPAERTCRPRGMKEMERALSLVFKSHSSRSANNRAVIVCELIEHNKDVDDNSEANKSLIEVLFPVGPAARTTGTCQSAEGGKVCSFDCLVSSDENLSLFRSSWCTLCLWQDKPARAWRGDLISFCRLLT